MLNKILKMLPVLLLFISTLYIDKDSIFYVVVFTLFAIYYYQKNVLLEYLLGTLSLLYVISKLMFEKLEDNSDNKNEREKFQKFYEDNEIIISVIKKGI